MLIKKQLTGLVTEQPPGHRVEKNKNNQQSKHLRSNCTEKTSTQQLFIRDDNGFMSEMLKQWNLITPCVL